MDERRFIADNDINTKSIILMKTFFKNFLYTGIPFGVAMGIFLALEKGLASGMIYGFLAGIMFGVCMALIIGYQRDQTRSARPFSLSDETFIYEGIASHRARGIAVGGWLFLTDQQILFKPHNLNFTKDEISISIHEIKEVTQAKSLGFINNKLIVCDYQDNKTTFLVENPRKWAEAITNLKNDLSANQLSSGIGDHIWINAENLHEYNKP